MKGSFNLLSLKEILLIIICIDLVLASSKCGKDLLKIKPKALNVKSLNKKTSYNGVSASSNTYQPIQIGFDFTNFFKPSSMSSSAFNKVKSLIIETANEFKKFIQIKHEDISLSGAEDLITESCYLDAMSSEYPYFLIDNDLIIFPSFNQDVLGDYALAAAGSCLYSASNYRPLGGVLYINPNLNFDKKNTDLYIKNILLHEITHILVFSPDLLQYKNMIQQSGSTYYINTPKVLEKAREHFNCNSISRVYLENQGGTGSAGSHWESRYMLGDYMISTDYVENALSDITLALFEDSGFYKVNYYSGGLFKYGKNKGCDFLNNKCIANGQPLSDEFCIKPSEPKCTSARTMKGVCYIREYNSGVIPSSYRYFTNPNIGGFEPANYCPIAFEIPADDDYYDMSCGNGQAYSNNGYGETFGDNSFCFISSLTPESSTTVYDNNTVCHQVRCDTTNKNIIIKIGSSEIICPTEGGVINSPSGFTGSIECPKYEEICSNNDDDVLCNELFDCLTKEAAKNNYVYSNDITSYDESDYVTRYVTNDKNYINMNLGLLLILFIVSFLN